MTETASPHASPPEPTRRAIWQSDLGQHARSTLLPCSSCSCFLPFMVPDGKFYSPRNLENIARQSAVYAIAAIGMTFVIVAGGIDLSIGSVIALTDVVLAWVLSWSTAATPLAGAPTPHT